MDGHLELAVRSHPPGLRGVSFLNKRLRVLVLLEAMKRLLPDRARPEVLDASVGGVVRGGVDRPEALRVVGVAQRRLEERGDEALALHGSDRAGVLWPLD